MTNVQVTDTVRDAIRNYASADKKFRKTTAMTATSLLEQGITSAYLISPSKPESLATKEFWAELKEAFFLAMTKSEQALVFADKKLLKGWSEEKKAKRKALQCQPNGQIADLRQALLIKEGNIAQGRAPSAPRTASQVTYDQLTKMISKFENIDAEKHSIQFDIVDFIDALKQARKLVK